MATELNVEPHHVFGLRRDVRNNLFFLDDETVIFPSGNHCVYYHLLERWNKFIPIAKRGKRIQSLAMSPNRRYLAVSEHKKQAKISIYDLQNFQCHKKQVLTTEEINLQEFTCMAFSSDSKYLLGLAGGLGSTLFYWEWENNEVISTQRSTRFSLSQVSFNPNDNMQICVTGKGVFRIFRLEKGRLKRSDLSKINTDNILCHTWLSEDYVVAGTDMGKLLLMIVKFGHVQFLESPYERQTEKSDSDGFISSQNEMLGITAITQYSGGFACSAGPALVCLYMNNEDTYRKIMEIRIPQDLCLQPNQAELQMISSMCIGPSGEMLAISTDQGQIYHIDLTLYELGKCKQAYFEYLSDSFHSGSITGLSVCSSKPLFATCSKDKSVRIWNYQTNSLEQYKTFAEEPCRILLHPNGLFMLVGFFNKICFINLLVDGFHTVQEFFIDAWNECVFNHDGNMFAAVSNDVIHVYNIKTSKKIELKGHTEKVSSVKWREDDCHLVMSCGLDSTVYEWNVLTGARKFPSIPRSRVESDVIYPPNTEHVLTLLREKSSDSATYTAISISLSGHAVFIGTSTGTVLVMPYPLQKMSPRKEYYAHSGPITKMVITPGDHYLLTASEDGSILIWMITDHLGRKLCTEKEISYTEDIFCTKTCLRTKDQILTKNELTCLKVESEHKLNQMNKEYRRRLDDMVQKCTQYTDALKVQNMLLTDEEEEKITGVFNHKELVEKKKKQAKQMENKTWSHVEYDLNQLKRQENHEEMLYLQGDAIEQLRRSCEGKLHEVMFQQTTLKLSQKTIESEKIQMVSQETPHMGSYEDIDSEEIEELSHENTESEKIQKESQENSESKEIQNGSQENSESEEIQNELHENSESEEIQKESQENSKSEEILKESRKNNESEEIQNESQENIDSEEIQRESQNNRKSEEIQNGSQENSESEEIQNESQENSESEEIQNELQENSESEEIQNELHENSKSKEIQIESENTESEEILKESRKNSEPEKTQKKSQEKIEFEEIQNDSQKNSESDEILQGLWENSVSEETQKESQEKTEFEEIQKDSQKNSESDEILQGLWENSVSEEIQKESQEKIESEEIQEMSQNKMESEEIQKESQENSKSNEILKELQKNSESEEILKHSQKNSESEEILKESQKNNESEEIQKESQENSEPEEIQKGSQENSKSKEILKESQENSESLQGERERNRKLLQYEKDLMEKQLLQLDKVRKEVQDRDMTIHKLKDDLKRIQYEHKDAVKTITELTKEREEQNMTIATQKKKISSLLTQLEDCKKEHEEKNVKRLLKQSKQERDQMKNSAKEDEHLQKKVEVRKTLLKETEMMRIINNKQIIEGLKKKLIAKDQELCQERHKVRNIKNLVERMKEDMQKGSNFLQHPKMLKDYFVLLNRRYIHKTDVTGGTDAEVMTEHTRQMRFLERRLMAQKKQHAMEVKNQEAYCPKTMKIATLVCQDLSQDRKKYYEMLKKQKLPSVERMVPLEQPMQESMSVIKIQRLKTEDKRQGPRSFRCSSGPLKLPPINQQKNNR
ncbi:uncharacterized protein Hap1MRO34_004213 [Clarias gariepinus]